MCVEIDCLPMRIICGYFEKTRKIEPENTKEIFNEPH